MIDIENFYEHADASHIKHHHTHASWKLYVDGAARNNPGPAGAGVYLVKNDELFLKKGFFLGSKTNNQAEYLALLLGIYLLKPHVHSHDTLLIISDSLLLVRQIKGEYKIKNTELRLLHAIALHMLHQMRYECCHVLREDNKEADKMANFGIDKKNPVPDSFITLLRQHEVIL